MDMSEDQKQTLETIVEGGAEVSTVAYNPSSVTGDPEGDAISTGWVQYARQASASLVEVVYTR
jgi:hypothetical protein